MREDIRKSVIVAILLLASGAHVYLSYTAPTQPTAPGFEILEPWRSILRITFILPVLLSWAFGAFAVHYLLTAAQMAPDARATRAFRLLGYGILALVMGSWMTSLIGQIRNNFFQRGSFQDIASTVATNYAYVLFPLIAFACIYLASTRRNEPEGRKGRNASVALLLITMLGALWLGIIFTNETRQTTALAFGRPTYYISDPLIILTIVTPTLVAWALGIIGALNLSDLESGGAPATRKAFSRIVDGLLLAVFNSMILNGLLSAGAERLLSVGLGILLAIVYIFIFLAALSYWMICRGAKQLLATPAYEPQE